MGRKVAEHVIELPDSYEGSTDSEELGRGFGILWRAGGLEGGVLYIIMCLEKKEVNGRCIGIWFMLVVYLLPPG